MAWVAVVEVSLAGTLLLWIISPLAAQGADYGPGLPIAIVSLAVVLTLVAAVVVILGRRVSRALRLTTAVALAVIAAGLVPLILAGLAKMSAGPELLLVLAVIGMEFVAVNIPRVRGDV